ncbi:MAG TPA: RsmD family RNA methyltransferase, partial [Planctomycetaceae bacterium]|nr:RsmD family RNA methyltransferase [Planctomycetaceae bacterium]
MQIVSGKYRHRKLETNPGETTRPITARVKVALFDRLQPVLQQAKVADVFSGTGTIGLEALSRGAASVVFIES